MPLRRASTNVRALSVQRLLTRLTVCDRSWKTAFTALSNSENVEQDGALHQFLSDETVIDVLSQPFNLYHRPSQQSKSNFETKTAAIYITPATRGQYNINEIKEDALWLSQETKIDEVVALRIVIQEWQNRPAVQLLSGFSGEELASIQDASGVENLRTSVGGARVSSLFSTVGTQVLDSSTFLSAPNRRFRFLDIYLSERRYALKVSQLLISAALDADQSDLPREHGASPKARRKRNGKESRSWVEEVAKSIYQGQRLLAKSQTVDGLLLQVIPAFELRIRGYETGSGWFEAEGGREEVEDAWATNMLEEMTHIMQIMFLHLHFSTDISSSQTVLLWFRLMSRHGFFEVFDPVSLTSGIKTLTNMR
jgi:nuclear pore complex protein Nup188